MPWWRCRAAPGCEPNINEHEKTPGQHRSRGTSDKLLSIVNMCNSRSAFASNFTRFIATNCKVRVSMPQWTWPRLAGSRIAIYLSSASMSLAYLGPTLALP